MKPWEVPLRATLILIALASPSFAQEKYRWRLSWTSETPRIFTYRHPSGELENFWTFTYDVTNNTDQIIPVRLGVQLYTEVGNELQHDVLKVATERIKEFENDPYRSSSLAFGRFNPNLLLPQHIEFKIIEDHAKLGNRSPGIAAESIENLKAGDEQGNRYYLNVKEMREAGYIQPGQRLQGIALFRNVDPSARILEVHVSGLADSVRIDEIQEFETVMTYENHVLRLQYDFKGDPYERERDTPELVKKEWIVRNIGPVASKETLGAMVDALLEAVNAEKEWREAGKTEEETSALREKRHFGQAETGLMANLIRLATGRDFAYDPEKTAYDNRAAVWRIHEWWTTNQSRLFYNFELGRFEVKDETLPGTVGTRD